MGRGTYVSQRMLVRSKQQNGRGEERQFDFTHLCAILAWCLMLRVQ